MGPQAETKNLGEFSYADLVQQTAGEFRVNTKVYTDPAIFEAELNTIFEKTWLYVGHESEVRQPGDYRTAYIGRQPVIVSRGDDGRIHVLLNTCRHRGNVVCREERGNVKLFRCSYHGWTYSNDGTLTGIAERAGYPNEFGRDIGGLLEAPRVAVYRGLIFASLSGDGIGLEDHLGEVREYVDLWVERSPAGAVRVLRPHRYLYPANWKFQTEQDTDGYHGRYVHESNFRTMDRIYGATRRVERQAAAHEVGRTRGFPGGHAVLERPGTRGELPSDWLRLYRELLTSQYGPERTERIAMVRHVLVFPNLYLMDDHLRVHYPWSVDETEVQSYVTFLEGVPEEINKLRLKSIQRGHSQAGFVGTDDVEMFVGCQSGMQGPTDRWVVLCRGLHREERRSTGERVGQSSDETPQRAIYREWARLMAGAAGQG